MTISTGSSVEPVSRGEPLVAVMTPVYNGGRYLERCLESVAAQSYNNWIQIVVDNASSDDSREIAESFRARDDRFVVRVESEHLTMVKNWNRGLSYVPPEAVYLKQLHADDRLRPHCLRTMVEAAESEPSASIVVSAYDYGSGQSPINNLRGRILIPGRDAARNAVLGHSNLLANPSIPLVRIASAPSWPQLFYEQEFPPGHPKSPPLTQADKEGYLGTLEQGNLLYIPESLIVPRRYGPGAQEWSRRVGAYQPGRLELLLRHGRRFCKNRELRSAIWKTTWRYAAAMSRRIVSRHSLADNDFLAYQTRCLQHIVPRLRADGFVIEAMLLASFSIGLRYASRGRTI